MLEPLLAAQAGVGSRDRLEAPGGDLLAAFSAGAVIACADPLERGLESARAIREPANIEVLALPMLDGLGRVEEVAARRLGRCRVLLTPEQHGDGLQFLQNIPLDRPQVHRRPSCSDFCVGGTGIPEARVPARVSAPPKGRALTASYGLGRSLCQRFVRPRGHSFPCIGEPCRPAIGGNSPLCGRRALRARRFWGGGGAESLQAV